MTIQSKGKSLVFWLQKKRFRRRRRGDRGTGFRTLEDVLAVLEPGVFQAERERCPVTRAQWQEVVGLRIAQRSAPRRLESDGALLVTVTSSVWAQELSMLSMTLCERLRSQGHEVKTVRFLVGAVDPVRRGPERFELRHVPAPAPIPREIRRDLEAIEDEELRDAIAAAMASSLAVSERKT
jgi:hypothetical protein